MCTRPDVGNICAGRDLQQCGLAGPVRTEDHPALVDVDVPVHRVQQHRRPAPHRDLGEMQHRIGARQDRRRLTRGTGTAGAVGGGRDSRSRGRHCCVRRRAIVSAPLDRDIASSSHRGAPCRNARRRGESINAQPRTDIRRTAGQRSRPRDRAGRPTSDRPSTSDTSATRRSSRRRRNPRPSAAAARARSTRRPRPGSAPRRTRACPTRWAPPRTRAAPTSPWSPTACPECPTSSSA